MKKKHKEIYLEKVVVPILKNKEAEEGIMSRNMFGICYMTIPEIKRLWRSNG